MVEVFFKLTKKESEVKKKKSKLGKLTAVDPTVQIGERMIHEPGYYHKWFKEFLRPELVKTGLAKYNAAKLKLWCFKPQKTGSVRGFLIYNNLCVTGRLHQSVSYDDLIAIQEKGYSFFQKNYEGKSLFAWKSIAIFKAEAGSGSETFVVPCLRANGVNLQIFWRSIDGEFNTASPAVLFIRQPA
jgi:hypothetical protein